MLLAAAGFAAVARAGADPARCPPTGRSYSVEQRQICWDGATYTRDTTGLPQHMLDYFDARQKAASAPQEAKKPAPEKVDPVPAPPVATVLRAPPRPDPVPVSNRKWASVHPGMTRHQALQILGDPPGTMEIPEEGGLTEVWTYRLEGGKSARIRIEHGEVVKITGPGT
jgi:hypothetical protein